MPPSFGYSAGVFSKSILAMHPVVRALPAKACLALGVSAVWSIRPRAQAAVVTAVVVYGLKIISAAGTLTVTEADVPGILKAIVEANPFPDALPEQVGVVFLPKPVRPNPERPS